MGKQLPLDQTVKKMSVDSNLVGLFRYNQFSEDIEFIRPPCWDESIRTGKTIDDDDLSQIRYYLTTIHGLEPSKPIVGEACFIVAKRNQYHPVKQFIESQVWDGVPRLNEWLIKSSGCVDNPYTRDVSRCMLTAAVNRVYNPGCKFDHMVILEGPQGIGKSTMVEEVCPGFYLDTNFDTRDKDLVDAMNRSLIIEISELSGMNKKDVDWLKSFITKKVDRVRLAYAYKTKDFYRKSIFVGTYNPSGNNNYFRDDTGNRRFWPIECSHINIEYIREVRAQLWAEAFHLYNKKAVYHIVNEESLAILSCMHSEREFEGPYFFRLKEWLMVNNFSYVSMHDIIEKGLGLKIEGKSMSDAASVWTVVGLIMKKLKWRKGTNDNRNNYYNPNHVVNFEE
jgi:putative DNA primase/helicase